MTTDGQARVRVVRIIDRLNIGGPAKHVVWLTAGLPPGRFDTTLVTGHVAAGEGDMTDFAEAQGVRPVLIRQLSREISPRDIVVIARLVALLFRVKPDIVHTHKAKAGAAGRVAATIYKWTTPTALWLRPRRVAIVHTYHGHVFHGYYSARHSALLVAIERLLAAVSTDRLVVVSERQRQEILGQYRVGRPGQYRVVPLGLDLDDPVPSVPGLREQYGVPPGRCAIGIVGRLCEVKNHALLLEAIARLKQDGVAATAFVIGDGHLRPALESRAAALDIGDRVVFTGFRRDVLGLYAGLDFVALTSRNEGTPLTLIEAMSRGLAVASTLVGGVADLLGEAGREEHGFRAWSHGVTSRPGDVAGLAEALRFLIEHPDVRRDMGERGRRFVRARHSKARLLHDLEQLYLDLLQSPQPSPRPARGQSPETARAAADDAIGLRL